ncbi:MAG: thioredoxin [Candidatus Melainabacteria bacterium]|nr:MAG: thioredoxin [Candidatus Melainabacteria bacterium]
MVIELNKNNFDKEVFKSNGITLVDFWSPWCGFCQKQLPIVNELNENLEGKIKVGTVNLDESPEIAQTYNIASIPTFILFKDGKIKNKLIGFQTKSQLLKEIDKL